MATAATVLVDGFVTLQTGVDTALDVEVVAATSAARAINLSFRSGLMSTRPGFTLAASPATGTYQGVGVWRLASGDRLVFVISGHVYWMSPETGTITDLGLLLDTSAQCFFVQADRYLVVQDGTSSPVILEELAGVPTVKTLNPLDVSDADPANWTVPLWAGTVGAYVHGRLHFSPRYLPHSTVNGRPYFISSDISLPDDPSTCLYCQEDEYYSGGKAHGLPLELGYVQAMSSFRNAQTGTGYGSLLVFGRRGVCAFDLAVPRELWSEQQIGQVLFFGPGTVSPWSALQVNDDVLYRGIRDLRSVRYATSQVAATSGSLSVTGLSGEMDLYFAGEDKASLPFVSLAYVGNRVFVTVGGTGGRDFAGLAVLDTAWQQGVTRTGAPVWSGVWQLPGEARIQQVVTAEVSGEPALFVFTSGAVYRLDETATTDGGTPIRSRLHTRAMNFQNWVDPKTLSSVEMGLSNLTGDVDMTVYFRPAHYALWGEFGTRSLDVPSGSLPQRRRKVRMTAGTTAETTYDPVTKETLLMGQAFEFALAFSGHVTVEYFRALATPRREGEVAVCDETDSPTVAASVTAGSVLGDYL